MSTALGGVVEVPDENALYHENRKAGLVDLVPSEKGVEGFDVDLIQKRRLADLHRLF